MSRLAIHVARAARRPEVIWGYFGDRGVYSPGSFDNAAFALAVGAISDVVEADTGLYILKLDERIAAATIPLPDASDRIRGYLLGTRGKAAIDSEVERLKTAGQVQLLTPL